MYHKILVPLDGSKLSEAALPYIENQISKLSGDVKVEVTLLQVLAPVQPEVIAGHALPNIPLTDEEKLDARQKAHHYLEIAGENLRGKGATVFCGVVFGDPAEEIVRVAEEFNADMIAMSTHGRSGLSRWAFGSVTGEVLRLKSRIPVLVIWPGQAS
jgi:nucleotide-binding universal stress UspA family protein